MSVLVNGERVELDTGASVRDLLGTLGYPDRGIAVAVDGVVVPKGRWDRLIEDASAIEIVTAVQGG
ncbi:sulfur carrier protein ThiS [Gordonia soli]|uniref:Thiamine biosynthesis protein ThiS n=1 Tax=Gordonia soli NBRC 108243 TaxID=1223545 RepID=M0QGF6_9ACTN|nr:sulfur carrier protein ThiS [Gordonia soli]GAC67534.1 thiamine biosynthesis protein ThiS [Gordonia soli NBRC 108243]